ncbi:efflux RND transporter permease subunit [Escherichia coli]|uniref:efflux RND transporter permease subunit n=1 Tax=Escherichia coli TaxID=562 RepID=UPI003AB94BD7
MSIHEVVKRFFEGNYSRLSLSCILFLQNMRATLISNHCVPVVLLGTFAVLSMFGYSINTADNVWHGVLAIGLAGR